MTLHNPAPDVRACTHIANPAPGARPTSANAPSRPNLRVVPASTHIENTPTEDHGTSAVSDLRTAVRSHQAVDEHPPTIGDAADNLWLDRDQVRHGRAGQLAAAAAGLAQILILSACWGAAHVFGASKTRAVILLLVLIAAGTTWAVTSHA